MSCWSPWWPWTYQLYSSLAITYSSVRNCMYLNEHFHSCFLSPSYMSEDWGKILLTYSRNLLLIKYLVLLSRWINIVLCKTEFYCLEYYSGKHHQNSDSNVTRNGRKRWPDDMTVEIWDGAPGLGVPPFSLLAGNITSQTCTHTCIDNHNLITCGHHGYTTKNHMIWSCVWL